MSITLDAITLPEDLIWTDEFDWTPIQQSEERGLTGANIIDSGVKTAGQPITLKGSLSSGWILRLVLKLLYAKLADNTEMTLTLHDGSTFQVRFNHKNKPIQSEPIIDYADPDDTDQYSLILKLFTV